MRCALKSSIWPVLALLAGLFLPSCEAADKARMKLVGIKVCDPEPESAEWVLMEAVKAASEKDDDKGWDRLQKVLHSSERSTNALRGWHEGNWKRMRAQMSNYVDDQGCFTLVDFKAMQGNVGIDYYVKNKTRDMPTPCAVYQDENNNKLWRVKRCSL